MSALQRLKARLAGRWPAAPLRRYLMAVILLATLPLAVLMSLQVVLEVRAAQVQIENNLSQSAAGLTQAAETEVSGSLEALWALAHADAVRQGHAPAVALLLRSPAYPRRDWHSVFLLDGQGNALLDTAGSSGLAPLGSPEIRALREKVGQTGPGAVAEKIPGAAMSGPEGVVVAVPVSVEGKLSYVLGARIAPAVWNRIAAANTPGEGHAMLHDQQLRVIGAAPDDVRSPAPASSLRSNDLPVSPQGLQRQLAADGRMVYAAWAPMPTTGWSARVALPAAPIDAAHRRAILAALSATGGSLVLGLAMASLLAARITRPLQELAMRGPTRSSAGLPVSEIALLRDALQDAARRDEAARGRLAAQAEEFETLFHNTPAPTAVALDAQCLQVRYNAAMQQLLGDPGAEGGAAMLHGGQALAPQQWPLQRAAVSGHTVLAQELEIRLPDRAPVSVIANAVPLLDADGRPRGAITVLLDITRRKLAEAQLIAASQELRENQGLMDLAQETGHVGFLYYRFADDQLDWTPGQCRLFARAQAPGGGLQGWFSLIDPAHQPRVEREFWTACALRATRQTLDYAITRASGHARWLSSRLVLRYDADGRAAQMLAVTVDMTEQKNAEHEQALITEREIALREQAEAAGRAKDEFLTMLSHELRNPLGAISAAVDVMEAAPPDSPTAAEARSIVARQTRNLAHMMTDLLDVGRAIAEKILLAGQPVNLADVVTRVHQALSMTGEAARHEVKLQLADAWVNGDAVRLEQVVTNLLTNAFRYTPQGGRIDVTVISADDHSVIEVRDTGPGIPPALMPNIFDLFVQGERTLDRHTGGLGIGLTLVRRLVELHHGTVVATSSPQGSCFTVRLPAVDASRDLHASDLPPSRRRSVLLVEDNEDVRTALRAKLELDGHAVHTAADGIEGLARLLSMRPEVSIVDIGLPGLTGLELARQARAAGYGGRMIALSGYGHERDVQNAMVAGFDTYLVKPVDRKVLLASLRTD